MIGPGIAAAVEAGPEDGPTAAGSAAAEVILVEEEPVALGDAMNLSDQEKARISQAVDAAERRTSAEIVPVLVARSGLYRDAQHRTGLALALLVLTSLLMGEAVWLPWGWHASNAAWLIAATLMAYLIGTWLGTWDPVIRAVTSTDRLRDKVRLRAERAFARHGISRTRDRTGVLLMVSLLERHVYVLPDEGVRSRVSPEQWNEVVRAVIEKLKVKDIAGGFCAGIERCGAILAEICPVRPGDNPDELPDRLVEEP
jgi:putative membrane protein